MTACLLLSACAEYTDVSSDAFAQKPGEQEQFSVDARACQEQADIQRSYELNGIVADEGDRHRIYSAAYTACMTSRGHKRRTHWYDFWEGYDW